MAYTVTNLSTFCGNYVSKCTNVEPQNYIRKYLENYLSQITNNATKPWVLPPLIVRKALGHVIPPLACFKPVIVNVRNITRGLTITLRHIGEILQLWKVERLELIENTES